MKTIKVYFSILLLILSITSCSDEDVTEIEDLETSRFIDESMISEDILELVNQHRESIGLSPIVDNDNAKQLAKEHTIYMISIDDINHNNFEKRFDELKEQENALGMGENVAKYHANAESVVSEWLKSEGHRKNIEGNYTHSGVTTLKDEEGRYYFTHIFFRK